MEHIAALALLAAPCVSRATSRGHDTGRLTLGGATGTERVVHEARIDILVAQGMARASVVSMPPQLHREPVPVNKTHDIVVVLRKILGTGGSDSARLHRTPDKILLKQRECWKRTNGFGVDIYHYLTDLVTVLPHAHSADD